MLESGKIYGSSKWQGQHRYDLVELKIEGSDISKWTWINTLKTVFNRKEKFDGDFCWSSLHEHVPNAFKEFWD
jgi:hypothetical protein